MKERCHGKDSSLSLYPEPKGYFPVNDPNNAFLKAGLTEYGFPAGSNIKVMVKTAGAYGTSGISPGVPPLSGKTIVFTGWVDAQDSLGTLVHELTHGFQLAHQCGNWDIQSTITHTKSCCMNYGDWFILDDGNPRRPIQWTNNMDGASLCPQHIRAIRNAHLDAINGAGW